MSGPGRKVLVVTDLDGTLLDASYQWEPARPAIERLRELGHPLVLNSSKTLPEMQALARALPTDAPLVAENGGLIAIPGESPLADGCPSDESSAGYHLLFPGVSRREILKVAHGLRESHGFVFEGFADWPLGMVIAHTGLDEDQAQAASDRSATEPILWNDTEAHLIDFSDALAPHGIRLLRGGRFIHLMGRCDKAGGMRVVLKLYQKSCPDTLWTTFALGDSANDLEMLNAADAAAVIPAVHGGPLLRPTGRKVFTASRPGPEGWRQSIDHFLSQA